MLSKSELEVVPRLKVHGFGIYLQSAWFEYHPLRRDVARGILPARARLGELTSKMGEMKNEFDQQYFIHLPKEIANPLKIEQEAWRLLSPRIRQHLQDFSAYVGGYSAENASCEQLLPHIDLGWSLLQKWDVISKSYSPKYEIAIYPKTGWSENDIQQREEAVRVLIRELSAK
jgi:hypothetical protein